MVILIILVMVIVVIAIGLMPWFFIQVPQYKSQCYSYGHETSRQVKVVQPNWGTVTCYVKMPNGWFDIDQIRQNNQVNE